MKEQPLIHGHTIANVTGLQAALNDKVPTTRTVNAKALSANISLNASDVGALAATHAAAGVTTTKIGNWDTAYGWGNHASAGYISSVPNDHVTNARLANMEVSTIKGRVTAGTGDPENLTVGQVQTLLGLGSAAYTASTAYRASSWLPTWTNVTGKPSTFTPEAHTHTIANVTGLQAALDGKAASSHSHAIANVTGLQTALDAKVTANIAIVEATKTKITYDSKGLVTGGAYLETTDIPNLAISKIIGLQTALNAKAASSHTHGSISNVGAIGTTANLVVMTGSSGVLGAKTAGTTSQYLRGDGAWATPPMPTVPSNILRQVSFTGGVLVVEVV